MNKVSELIDAHIKFLILQAEINKADNKLWGFIMVNIEALMKIKGEMRDDEEHINI